MSRSASGAAVDRHEDKRHTSVFNLLETTRSQRRVKEDEESASTPTVTYSQEEEDEDYYDYEPDYEMSGDYDTHMPRGEVSIRSCSFFGEG